MVYDPIVYRSSLCEAGSDAPLERPEMHLLRLADRRQWTVTPSATFSFRSLAVCSWLRDANGLRVRRDLCLLPQPRLSTLPTSVDDATSARSSDARCGTTVHALSPPAITQVPSRRRFPTTESGFIRACQSRLDPVFRPLRYPAENS